MISLKIENTMTIIIIVANIAYFVGVISYFLVLA